MMLIQRGNFYGITGTSNREYSKKLRDDAYKKGRFLWYYRDIESRVFSKLRDDAYTKGHFLWY
jgi:predicted alpha/beta-fold hydrolase